MTPVLDTLMLAFAAGDGLAVPERALFLGAQPHPDLSAWPSVAGWQPLKPVADAWERAGFSRVEDPGAERFPLVMLIPGKSRDETLAGFAMARGALAPGGTLVAAIPNTAGAARFEKEFARATGQIISIQKHKCRAFFAKDDGSWDESLFAEWAGLGGLKPVDGTPFLTIPGVFSSGHIDPGSLFLAESLPAHLHGTMADLGAGWGFLTDAALRKCPGITRADLYEADSRALQCARMNLTSHTVDITYHWHDVTAGLAESYDVILMNPPFHSGQATDVNLGRSFLTQSARALRRGGRLYLVANRQLPYETVLDSLRLSWRKTAENKTYKILAATRHS